MERDVPFGIHPVLVREVRRVDDERVAFPVAYRISAVGRRHIVAMRTAVGRNQFEAVVRLSQHHHELRRLHDLADEAKAEQAHVQRTERNRNAAKRRIILVAQAAPFRQRFRFVEALK